MKSAFWRFVGGALALTIAAVGVLYLVGYIRYRRSPEYRVEQGLKELERQYREDKYGGDTPEETLRLFIDALKKGDVELASRYFVVEKQEDKLADLKVGKEKGNLENTIQVLRKADYPVKYSDGSYEISVVEKDGSIKFGVHFVLNKISNRWKIESL